MVLDAFNKSGLSQKELVERLGWDAARVSRCLAASSNWTIRTISALLAAIGVDLDDPSYTSFDELERRLTAHMPASSARRPVHKQSRAELLATIQLELALEARNRSGGSITSFPVIPNPLEPLPYSTKAIPTQALGEKVTYLDEYKQKALGHGAGNLPKMGVR